jgi:gluconolactonase
MPAATKEHDTPLSVEIRDAGFTRVVGKAARLERLGTGYLFTEGPVWHPVAKHLVFSDIPGDELRRWSAAGGVVSFRKPSHMANGNTYDRQGRLVTCEHATSRVTRTELDGRITVLATDWRGKALNSPNDVVVSRNGDIYFTDPIYGRVEYYGVKREPELAFRGLYRIAGDSGALNLLADDFAQPNGLCFSGDEARLFVNDTARQHIRVFDVESDGTASGGKVWAETKGDGKGAPDGMKIDSEENLYCCGPGGIHVFDRNGGSLGVIRLPEGAANFAFGGDDCRSLFVTASTSLYRLEVRVPGRPAF